MPLIALDARSLQDASRFRGIGISLRHLLPRLVEEKDLVLLVSDAGPLIEALGIPVITFPVPGRVAPTSAKYGRLLADFLRDRGVAHVHFYAQYWVPEHFDLSYTMTVHDLFTMYRGQNSVKDDRLVQGMKHRWAGAKRWLAISQFVKRELIERLGYPEARIDVIHPGFPTKLQDFEPDSLTLTRLKINRPYVLSVGDFEARKNQSQMIEAFLKMNDRLGRKFLYVACIGRGVIVPPLLALKLWILGRWGEFRFVNYVEAREMAALYQNAALLSFVSKAEGFGLPVLEGLAYRIPVLTSTETSLPEVGQDAVAYANPDSVPEISDQMLRVVSDPTWVAVHMDAAKRVVQQFSYDRMAVEMLAAIRGCVG